MSYDILNKLHTDFILQKVKKKLWGYDFGIFYASLSFLFGSVLNIGTNIFS